MVRRDYVNEAVELLKALIATPSVSRNEEKAADVMEKYLRGYGLDYYREGNNIWCMGPHRQEGLPTLLLNAHIDTVKPVDSWSRPPFVPTQEGDMIYGLGSNDCGGGLVSLLQVFRYLITRQQPYQVIYLASAEEEVSGKDGISRVLPLLPKIDVAVVGEPTGMQPAIAEKGLMVLDVVAHGKSGHAARNEGVNAIYQALEDMRWFRDYRFKKVSDFLGPTQMNLTVVKAGTQHNVIPDRCEMVVDVRTNELYTNQEVLDFIKTQVKSFLFFKKTINSIRLVDKDGIIRLQRKDGVIAKSKVADASRMLNHLIEEYMIADDGGEEMPNIFIATGSRIIDLSGMQSREQMRTLAEAELGGLNPDEQLLFLCTLKMSNVRA